MAKNVIRRDVRHDRTALRRRRVGRWGGSLQRQSATPAAAWKAFIETHRCFSRFCDSIRQMRQPGGRQIVLAYRAWALHHVDKEEAALQEMRYAIEA